jgi:outer membrane protein OmpA-like peptidoglycan-associated protein
MCMKTIIDFGLCLRRQSFRIATLFLVCTAGSVSAQQVESRTKGPDPSDSLYYYKLPANNFWNHWFIQAGGGGRTYFGDHNRQMQIKDRLSLGAELNIGKWWTPAVGTRIGYSYQPVKGATQNGSHSTGKVYDLSQGLSYQKYDVGHVYGDVLFNLTNLFCGVNEHRVYSFTPYVGLGWMRTWNQPQASEISASLGLMNSFRLCDALDLTLDIRGAMVNDRFDGEVGGRKNEGLLSASLGFVYYFDGKHWSKPVPKRMNDTELALLQQRLQEMDQQNASLRDRLASVRNQPKEIQKILEQIKVVSDVLVIFPIGKSTLSQDARVNIGFAAELMKAFKESSYTITGYADEGTGSPALNDRLSRDRADAVKNCLVQEFGISASRLSTVAAGGIGNWHYNNPKLSRAAVISPNK